MLPLTYDYGDWQFVSNQAVMSHTLDGKSGSGVLIEISSEKPVTVLLVQTEEPAEFIVAKGDNIQAEFQSYHFDKIEVRAPRSTEYAVRLIITDNLSGEANSGEPAVMIPDETEDMRINRQAQLAVVQELAHMGIEHDDIMDLLTGLNSDEDLSFDDEAELPTVAEMNEMIDEARLRAAEEVTEEPSSSPAGPPPDDSDSPPPEPSDGAGGAK